MDWFDLLVVQGNLKSLHQHTVQKYQFFINPMYSMKRQKDMTPNRSSHQRKISLKNVFRKGSQYFNISSDKAHALNKLIFLPHHAAT